MERRMRNVLLLLSITIMSASFVSAQECFCSQGTNSHVNGAAVTCTVDEQAGVATVVCDFYAQANVVVNLAKYGTDAPDITQFMTLTSEQSLDGTKATLTLITSVDDVADTDEFVMGGITCPPSMASVQQNRWRSMIDSVSATAQTYLTVTFNSVNDHAPEFPETSYVVNNLPETFPDNIDALAVYGVPINATDADLSTSQDSKITFSLADYFDGSFSVEATRPDPEQPALYAMSLKVLKVLDYNKYQKYDLTVIAKDAGTPQKSSTVTLTLNIDDEDNLDPKFQNLFYYADAPELSAGQKVLTMAPADILAMDQDMGLQTPVQYSLVFYNEGEICSEDCDAISKSFSIDPTTGAITMDTDVPGLESITSRVASFAVTATQVDDPRHFANAFVSVSLPPSLTTPATTTTTTTTTTTPATTGTTTPTSTGTTVYPCTTINPTPCPTPPPCPTVDTTTTTECPTPPPCPTTTPCPTLDTTTACPTPPPCPTVDTTVVTEPPSTCPTPPPCPTWDTSTATVTTNCPPCPTDATAHTGSTSTPIDCDCPTSGTGPTNSGSTDCPTIPTDPTDAGTSTPASISTECPPTPCTTIIYSTPFTDPTRPPTTTRRPTTTTFPKSTYSPAPANNLLITVKNVSIFTEVNTILVQMREVDSDDGEYIYSLESNTGDQSSYFGIDSMTGDVFVKSLLHHSETPYRLTVFAEGPGVTDTASLDIEVVDSAGITVFDVVAQEYSIEENVQTASICNLNSYYEDNQYTRQYWISHVNPNDGVNSFRIDQSTGELTLINELDYETSHQYDVTVTVETTGDLSSRSVGLGDEPVSLEYNQAVVRINVVDVNDHAPQFDVYGIDGTTLSVGISSYTTSGQDVIQLSATDADTADDNKRVKYDLDDNDHFYINEDTGLIRASTSLESLEFGSSVHSYYNLKVTSKNIAEGQTTEVTVTVYILAADQILVLNTTKSPEDFDSECAEIVSTLKEETGSDVRVLEYEDNKSASAPMNSLERRSAVGDDDVLTTVYLYAFGDSGPLNKDELMNLISEHGDSFAEFGFKVDSAAVYSDVGPIFPVDDNSTYIIAISCLAALAGVALIATAVLTWQCMLQKRRVKNLSSSSYEKLHQLSKSSDVSEMPVKKNGNGVGAVQALSPGWTRTSVQMNPDDQLRTDNVTAELVSELDSRQLHDDYSEPEVVRDVETHSIEPEVAARVEAWVEEGNRYEENRNNDSSNDLSNFGDDDDTKEEHEEPDPDYLQSILVDPNAPKIDDDSKSTKSGVTFNETAEVISVVPLDLDDDDMARL